MSALREKTIQEGRAGRQQTVWPHAVHQEDNNPASRSHRFITPRTTIESCNTCIVFFYYSPKQRLWELQNFDTTIEKIYPARVLRRASEVAPRAKSGAPAGFLAFHLSECVGRAGRPDLHFLSSLRRACRLLAAVGHGAPGPDRVSPGVGETHARRSLESLVFLCASVPLWLKVFAFAFLRALRG
jgi:hypothetical protein